MIFIRFYDGKVYRIVLNGVFTILPLFKRRYIENLGPPNFEEIEPNEPKYASFGWQDELTKIFIVHTAGKVWIDSVQVQ